jgi:universal stress protein E
MKRLLVPYDGSGNALRALPRRLARSLADACNGSLEILSCWDFPFEDYLRSSPWMAVPEDELAQAVNTAQPRHRAALDDTIGGAGIAGTVHVYHGRGRVDQLIPRRVADRKIDILVMGTVARTGIPGFIMGNTAENLAQQLECSLLAAKPDGFVSPVKAH